MESTVYGCLWFEESRRQGMFVSMGEDMGLSAVSIC